MVFATSDGCKTAMLSKEGVLQSSEHYLPGCNVSNIEKIQGEKVIVTYNDEEGLSKIQTVDTGTDQVDLVIDQDDYNTSFDIDVLPGFENQSFYMLH